jgi:hypothetical protein
MTRYLRDSQMFEKPISILGKTVATLPSDAPNGSVAYVTDDPVCRLYVHHEGVWIRVASSGPFMLGPWGKDNVETDLDRVAVKLVGDASRTDRVMMDDGDILGIAVQCSEECAAGSLTVEVTVNGNPCGLEAVLAPGHQIAIARQDHGVDVFTAGQKLGVAVSTSSDWDPTTADIAVEVLGNDQPRSVTLGTFPQFGFRRNVPVQLHIFSRSKVDLNLFANIANGIVLQGFLEVKP